MPNCRNCGARLNKWDNDVCPVCGIKNPLEGVTSDTVEITRFGLSTEGADINKQCTRKKTMSIFFSIGWTGAGFFYLHKIKAGLLWLLINLIIIGGFGCLFTFACHWNAILGFLLSLVIAYLANAVVAVYYFFANDAKDGNGEYII